MTGDMSLDPITLELIHNGLRAVTDETWTALRRSAYSTNIKERHDHSTAIIDTRGRLVAQAHLSLPTHLGAIIATMEALLQKYGVEGCDEGDVFISNDPHVAGGTHLPDVNIATPVFVDGKVLAFVCTIAHHADIGGMCPGSMDGCMTEIYQEGLRMPVMKLLRRGTLNRELMDFILLNVRVPEERQGDYFAQIAAVHMGQRRLMELVKTYSAPVLEAAFDEIIERTNRRMRQAIRDIPDGSYTFEDVVDDDGLGTYDIPIKVRVDVSGDDIFFDFTGTASQVPGNINAPLNATHASVCYILKALLDPDIPNNQGVRDAVKLNMPPGTIGNAVFPAAVATRNHLAQRLVDVVMGALAQALPERATAASNGANTSLGIAGTDEKTGQSYVYFETIGGGGGGRFAKDGRDAVQVHITNTSNSPVEAFEMEYPLRIEEYALVPDSGGAGRHRGGLGIRRVIRPVGHTARFNAVGERFRHAPWGLDGGGDGLPGRFLVVDDAEVARTLPGKAPTQPLRPNERLVIESPGSGGYGVPAARAAEAVAEDLESGKFSRAYLERHYGQLLP
jgi:N-methylhydantoinase B